ncbi:MAG: DUF4426 domain-containing protein [Pseudomonadales bacterium]|nr:DUF4426 domain-containing protein [Pseudomonadales bacterium]
MPIIRALLFVLFAAPCLNAHADTSDLGAYTVHYLALNSTFLEPVIAAQYGIERGSRLGLINVAVLRDNPNGIGTPVSATLSGGKYNLLQQSTPLTFKEVREGEAIYYLAQFDFSNAETLRFTLEVQPEGQGEPHEITWTTQLYAD